MVYPRCPRGVGDNLTWLAKSALKCPGCRRTIRCLYSEPPKRDSSLLIFSDGQQLPTQADNVFFQTQPAHQLLHLRIIAFRAEKHSLENAVGLALANDAFQFVQGQWRHGGQLHEQRAQAGLLAAQARQLQGILEFLLAGIDWLPVDERDQGAKEVLTPKTQTAPMAANLK